MGLNVRQMEVFKSTTFDSSTCSSLYDFVGYNQSGTPVYSNDAAYQNATTNAYCHPTIDRLISNSDQSTRCQAMRSDSDLAFKQSQTGADAEHLNGVVTLIDRQIEEQLTDPKAELNRFRSKLKSIPDHLCTFSLQSSSSIHPELSEDSVFQDNERDDPGVNPSAPLDQHGTDFFDNQVIEGQVIPSTTSTDFSLGGSVIDTASQSDLCEKELNENSNQGGGRITLADYFHSLDDPSSTKLLKPIPQLAHIRRIAGVTASTVSDPSLFSKSIPTTQPLTAGVYHADTPNLAMAPVLRTMDEVTKTSTIVPSASLSSEEKVPNFLSGTNMPKTTGTPIDYLLKRRIFLLERLVERYDELLKLMHEELELTGHPPKNYLECVNDKKVAHATLCMIQSSRPAGGLCNSKDEETGTTHGDDTEHEKTRLSDSGAQLPPTTDLYTNRLQETGFLLSPKVVRKVAVKLSPSANNLLLSSQLSLRAEDSHSIDGPDLSDRRTILANDQCPLHSGVSIRSKSVSKPGLSSSRRRHPLTGWTKRKQCGNLRNPAGWNRTGENDSTGTATGSIPLSVSLSDLTCRCAGELSQEAPSKEAADPENGKRRASIASITCSLDHTESPDRAQALAWIEVELEAVRKILEANRKCAAEHGRKRESRKAYQLACQKNEQAIAQLERQKLLLLQSKLHSDSDKSSLGCGSQAGGYSITSGLEPGDDDHGSLATASEFGSEESASISSTERSRQNRLKLDRSISNPRSNMVDGLSTLTPNEAEECRARSLKPAASDRDLQDEPIQLKNPKPQVILIPSRDSTPNPQSTRVPSESDQSIRIINQVVPVHHQRVLALGGFDELVRLPSRMMCINPGVSNNDPIPCREVPCDTGLGTSPLQSVHNASSSDLSQWSIVSAEIPRSISSGKYITDTFTQRNGVSPCSDYAFPSTTSSSKHPNGAIPTNGLDRVQREERQSPKPKSNYTGHVTVIPRISIQPALNNSNQGFNEKDTEKTKVHCSRLPAYRTESPVINQQASPTKRNCEARSRSQLDTKRCLPREITTVYETTLLREPIQSSTTHFSYLRAVPPIGGDLPVAYEFHPSIGEQGTQTTRVAYSILPKFSGPVNTSGSGRLDYDLPNTSVESHRHQTPNGYESASLVLPVEVRYPLPADTHCMLSSKYMTRSTNTPAERRVIIHSQSGETTPYRNGPKQMNLINCSHGLSSSSSQCCGPQLRPAACSIRRSSSRSRSFDPVILCFRTSEE